MVTFLLVNSSGEALNCSSSKSEVKHTTLLAGYWTGGTEVAKLHHSALAFLQGALVGRPVSSDDVEDPEQLQDVLHATGVLAATRLGLGRFSGHTQDLTALISRERVGTETA